MNVAVIYCELFSVNPSINVRKTWHLTLVVRKQYKPPQTVKVGSLINFMGWLLRIQGNPIMIE